MEKENESLNYDQILELMSLYREEWMHRDSDMMSTLWRLVSIALIITFLPNLIGRIGVQGSPLVEKLPVAVFSGAGILCSAFGFYISMAEAKRIEFIDEKYWEIMALLPQKFHLKKMNKDKRMKLFSIRLNNIFCLIPYLVVTILAISNILFHYFL